MEKDLKYKISLEDFLSGGLKNAEHNANKFEHAIDGIGEHLRELKHEVIAAVGVFELFEFAKESFEEFLEASKTAAQLKFTIGKKGGLAEDFSELTEESEKLGKSSFFNSGEIKSAANQLLNYGISVKETKESLQALTDVGVAKGKGLSEVISAVGMAAAGGRSMGLKEYGLGFLNLEKDMSVAGAEAKNFNTIMKALKGEFAGATDSMSGEEFFKLKKIQDEFKEFKEEVGKYLMKGFEMILPYIRQGIEYLKEFTHWLKEHKELVKAVGIGLITGAVAFKAFALAEDVALLSTEALTAALLANPFGLIALGVAGLTAGIVALADSYNELREMQDQLAEHEQDLISKEETSQLQKRYEDLKQFKDEEMRQERAIFDEKMRLQSIIEGAKDRQAEQYKKGIFDGDEINKQQNIIDQFNKRLRYIKDTAKSDLFKSEKGEKGKQGDEGLGSGLSEPKASKIQNITINLNNPFNNQKITMGGGNMNPKDVAVGLIEMLTSVVTDAAIVAAE